MKDHVEQAAAEFLEEMAQLPDQVLQQSAFRLKRRVKGLYQVVSDLECPVASVLSLKLEITSKAYETSGQALHQPATGKAHIEQIQQRQALQSYTQVGFQGSEVASLEAAIAAATRVARTIHCTHTSGRLEASQRLCMVQAGMALIASTIERAQVEAMILLNQTSEMPGQQVSCKHLNGLAS